MSPRPVARDEALRRLLPDVKWFKNHIYDAIEVGHTMTVAKRLAVAEHKAKRSGMCFMVTPDRYEGEEDVIFVQAFKPSDCGYNGPKPRAFSVGSWSVNAPDTDDAAIRYAKAAAAAEYFGDRPLRRSR
jgi:hypothetical protein